MDVRIWGVVEDRLIEICVASHEADEGLRIEGLPEDRVRTTTDRVRAALLNSGLAREVPRTEIRLVPPVRAGRTSDLDLALAVALLARADQLGVRPRWIVANGRLGLDGSVHAARVTEQLTLQDIVDSFACQTPSVESQRMFAIEESHE